MAEYSRLASGQVSSLGGATSVIIPFLPTRIEIFNETRATAGTGVTRAWWAQDMGQGAAGLSTMTAFATTPAVGASVDSFIAAGGAGFSTFQRGLALQYGPQLQIVSITKANPAVVTTAANHGLVTGNMVVLQGLFQSSTTGMPQIAGMPFAVTVIDATSFSIPWNTNQSNYTALSGSPSGAFVRQVLTPALYAPGISFISAITLGSTTSITTTSQHNLSVGQEVAFRIPQVWGTTQLNSLPNAQIPGSPVYGYVTAVGSSRTATININSTNYSAFNSNPTVAQSVGLSFPQIVAVGDNNTGSLQSGFASPSFNFSSGAGSVATINGPTIAGAFANNTSMGFIIGSGVAGTAADVIDWVAYLDDLAL